MTALGRLLCIVAFLLIGARASAGGAEQKPSEAEKVFATRVLPLLKVKCFGCHGDDPSELRGKLNLTARDAMLQGGESGRPAVVPGRPDESLLYVAATRSNPNLAMPPKENDKLSADEVEAIRQWIAGDAPWPPPQRIAQIAQAAVWEASIGVPVSTSGGLTPEWTDRKYPPENLWAYRPLERPTPPAMAGSASHPIDAFVEAKLSVVGITPASPADRRSLIRRATFDLLGLPPTPEEVEAFVADSDNDDRAFARVIDRLLASPHYGEQWGRHWLDVARYADSAGFANDYERGSAWRYRDYVIRSFNADKPYDQFIREQLAGDEIDATNPEMLVAAGFLRMGPWELTGMEVPKVARQRFLDDVTETMGQVFLAHPLQCARCHDHKFDPVPTRDYYRIQAALATTQLAERSAPFLPTENTSGFDERKYLEARKARYEAVIAEIEAKQEAAARQWCAERGLDYIPRARGLRDGVPESKLPPAHVGLDTHDLGIERIARKGLERLKWEFDRFEAVAHSVFSGTTPQIKAVYAPMRMPADRMKAGELDDTCILAGGDPFSPTEQVTPGVLSAVAALNHASEQLAGSVPTTIDGRRRALADWIASPHNPLTPRVVVNRIWLGHFGQALAGNPNNFGATGKKPTHPELLDWLAAAFVERGWSVKAMHRLIMMSQTYRRAARHPDPGRLAERDPDGTSYAVFRPRRLAAEELRDAMLAVSGELNPAIGGIPVRPELNLEVALQPRQVMGTFAPAWQPSPRPDQRHRRAIYALKLRGLRDPFFEVFNQPTPDTSCEWRDASTVTPQVFSLLQGQATAGRALAFALRVLAETRSREQAIERAFVLAFGRSATGAESRACIQHWREMTDRHSTLISERPSLPREVLREAVEENTGEKFTFTESLDAAADFVSDLHPADVGPEVRGLMEVCRVLMNANEFVYVD